MGEAGYFWHLASPDPLEKIEKEKGNKEKKNVEPHILNSAGSVCLNVLLMYVAMYNKFMDTHVLCYLFNLV